MMNKKAFKAQSVLEFTVGTVIFVILSAGAVTIMNWAYRDLATRADAHQGCMDGGDFSAECGATPIASFAAPQARNK